MNYIFITIIACICFFCLLGTIHSIASMIERRKMTESLCKMYMTLGSAGMSIDEVLKAVSQGTQIKK